MVAVMPGGLWFDVIELLVGQEEDKPHEINWVFIKCLINFFICIKCGRFSTGGRAG